MSIDKCIESSKYYYKSKISSVQISNFLINVIFKFLSSSIQISSIYYNLALYLLRLFLDLSSFPSISIHFAIYSLKKLNHFILQSWPQAEFCWSQHYGCYLTSVVYYILYYSIYCPVFHIFAKLNLEAWSDMWLIWVKARLFYI